MIYNYNCLLFIIIPPVTAVFAHDAEGRKDNAKRVWSTQRSQGKTGRHLDILLS